MMTASRLRRRISRLTSQLERYKDETNLSVHGMWTKGYIMGKLSALEDLLDELEEQCETS